MSSAAAGMDSLIPNSEPSPAADRRSEAKPSARAEQPVPIPFRVNFVTDSLKEWEADAGAVEAPDVDRMPERIRNPESSWILQSYLRLRRRGHDVRLTDKFISGEVCVAHSAMKGSNRPDQSFAISVQSHLLVARICEMNIVQNQLLAKRSNQHWLPHWPQPGLIPRDPSRGARLERIAYFGDESLAPEFTRQAFRNRIAELGLTLVTPLQWNDYSDIDAVLAVRNVPPSYLTFKPASKLYNAWAAGVPALLGAEPAFGTHRRSSIDFFEVQTPQDVLAALTELKTKPDLYREMVENGHRRSVDFTSDAVASKWEALLSGPVADRYSKWCAGPKLWRQVRNRSRFAARVLLHKQALAKIERYNRTLKKTGFGWGNVGGTGASSAEMKSASAG